jgi:hypothetical protein
MLRRNTHNRIVNLGYGGVRSNLGGGLAVASLALARVAGAPEPPLEKSAGPVCAGHRTWLAGKAAMVTGVAHSIGRAIAVEFAANGADLIAIDVGGPVSPASNAEPATPAQLAETVRQIQA